MSNPTNNLSLKSFTGADNNRPIYPKVIDINSNFHYSDKPLLVTDVDAVNNELYNLVYTTPGERPFEPTYGLALWQKIFDPCDDITAWEIKTILIGGLNKWMKHIQLKQSIVTAVPAWPGFQISIIYSYRGLSGDLTNGVDFSLLQTS